MTKVTILGGEQKKELKKIEFKKALERCSNFKKSISEPEEWDNIILLEKNYTEDNLDLMYAYDNKKDGCLYLGHFNDGVV